MSDGQFLVSPSFVKPLMAAVVSGFLDRAVLKNDDFNSNAIFAVSVGVSTFIGDYIGEAVSTAVPDSTVYVFSGKTILQRAIEIGTGSAGAYAINRFGFSNDFDPSQMTRKLGVIVISQIIGEYGADYISGKPLGYLA
jgi:hypothetical protein